MGQHNKFFFLNSFSGVCAQVRFAEGVVDEEHPLNERFKRDNPDGRLVWMEEPEKITCGSGALYFECRPGTDCWQRTGLDVSRDNPHFLHIPRVR